MAGAVGTVAAARTARARALLRVLTTVCASAVAASAILGVAGARPLSAATALVMAVTVFFRRRAQRAFAFGTAASLTVAAARSIGLARTRFAAARAGQLVDAAVRAKARLAHTLCAVARTGSATTMAGL